MQDLRIYDKNFKKKTRGCASYKPPVVRDCFILIDQRTSRRRRDGCMSITPAGVMGNFKPAERAKELPMYIAEAGACRKKPRALALRGSLLIPLLLFFSIVANAGEFIGPEGGEVSSSDSKVKLIIPAAALSQPT